MLSTMYLYVCTYRVSKTTHAYIDNLPYHVFEKILLEF